MAQVLVALGIVFRLTTLIRTAIAENRDLTPEEIDAVTQRRHGAEDGLDAELARRQGRSDVVKEMMNQA